MPRPESIRPKTMPHSFSDTVNVRVHENCGVRREAVVDWHRKIQILNRRAACVSLPVRCGSTNGPFTTIESHSTGGLTPHRSPIFRSRKESLVSAGQHAENHEIPATATSGTPFASKMLDTCLRGRICLFSRNTDEAFRNEAALTVFRGWPIIHQTGRWRA